MEKYYLDTAIWRDLHENRTDRFRPLGEWAFELLRKIRKDKSVVLYSDLVVEELLINYEIEDINKIFHIAKKEKFLNKIEINFLQVKESKMLSKTFEIPKNDCLHAILARDNSAILVSRDRHFELIQHISTAKKPEDLI